MARSEAIKGPMFPTGEKPVSRKARKGVPLWAAIAGFTSLTLASGLSTYMYLDRKDVTPDNYPSNGVEAPAVSGANFEIGIPEETGCTVDGEGRITPDFVVNKDYDFSNINSFFLALAEANKNRDSKFYREKIMLPGAEATWGWSLTDLEEYKIRGIKKAVPGNIPELPDDAGEGCEFYELSVSAGTEWSRNHGRNELQRYLLARKGGRFYLVDGI